MTHEQPRIMFLHFWWHTDGRLLLATVDGRLQIARWSADGVDVETEADVGRLVPDPAPPPAVARRWW